MEFPKLVTPRRTIEKIFCGSIHGIPPLEQFLDLPRRKAMRFIFDKLPAEERRELVRLFRKKLPGFYVSEDHRKVSFVTIARRISEEEVEQHQEFFAECARDFSRTSVQLIFDFIAHLDLPIDENFPRGAFERFRKEHLHLKGMMGDWYYSTCSYFCDFANLKTGQLVQVPTIYGCEFDAMDGCALIPFIRSTKAYQPLPIEFYEDETEGEIIVNALVKLGVLKMIKSRFCDFQAAVIRDFDRNIDEGNTGANVVGDASGAGSFWDFGRRKN
jgi:hypothetical protein